MSRTSEIVRAGTWSPGPGCHGGCGVILHIENGRLIKVEGDPEHPFLQGRLCPRGLAFTQFIYHPDRLLHPLKRVGERGEGKWQRIPWNEALDTIEKKMIEIRDKYGAESMVFAQGTGRDVGGPISFLAYSYGSPNWTQLGLSGHSCYTPRLAGMYAVMADFAIADASQFFADRYSNPNWKLPKCLIIWGRNPMGAPCADHFFTGSWVIDMAKMGSKLIVIDPKYTWVASKADLWLPIRPGTDGALALGMLNVIINEDLFDKDFVEQWTYGFDKLKERVQEYPPEKVSEITWIPKDKILEAARLYAMSKPASIIMGVAIDMVPNGTTVVQAVSYLWTITGNLDIPGGNVIQRPPFGVTMYPYSTEELVELYGEELVSKLRAKRIGADKYPMVRDFRGWAQPDTLIKQLISNDPYPLKGMWVQGTNFLVGQTVSPKQVYDAVKKLELVVAVDVFLNPTITAFADIVLPAATFVEKESVFSIGIPLNPLRKALKIGECRSDWEINLELARRFNPGAIKWKTVREMLNDRLKPSGMSYDDLCNAGYAIAPIGHPTAPYKRYQNGLLRQDRKPGFRTETGKVELYSKTFEKWGIDPLPYYVEPYESPIATPDLWKQYPLILVTGSRETVFFHGEHRNIPWLRELKPEPTAQINTKTAKEYGIEDGDKIQIENRWGRCLRTARLSPSIHPKVVDLMHSWWLPEKEGAEPSLYGMWEINANNMIPVEAWKSDSGFGGGPYKTMLCKIYKA